MKHRMEVHAQQTVQIRRRLTAEEFFFVTQDNYDDHVERAIPWYREMHEEATRCLSSGRTPTRILDLGSGTGKTAHVLLQAFPGCRVRCIEIFEGMARHSRERLAEFSGRVEHVLGDFMEAPLGKDFDVCIAALAVHHQTAGGKRELFRRIHEALVPGGRFIMIDWTRFSSSWLQELSFKVAEEHLRAQVEDLEIISEWTEHWRKKNIPETVEDLIEWLVEAGFQHPECIIRYYGMALIYAEKPYE